MLRRLSISLALITVLIARSPVFAATPPKAISFMGVLASTIGQKLNGSVPVTFRLYAAASGGSSLWSENQTVTATNGVFSTVLGTVTPFPSNLDFSQPYFVGVVVNGDAEMTPRVPLASVPYALYASNVATDASLLAKVSGGAMFSDGANVGIGTSSPATSLEIYKPVAGGLGPVIRLTGCGNLGAQAALDLSTYAPGQDDPGTRILATDVGGYTSDLDFMTKDGGAQSNFLVSRLHISAGGNIGVGTTSPGQKLTVAGNIESTSGGFKFPDGTIQATAVNSPGTLTSVATGAGLTGGPITSSGTISIAANGVTNGLLASDAASLNKVSGGVMVSSGGNVGIGTGSPSQKLSVAGTIESTSGGFKFPDGTTLTTAAVTVADNSVTNAKLAADYASLGKVTSQLVATPAVSATLDPRQEISSATCKLTSTVTQTFVPRVNGSITGFDFNLTTAGSTVAATLSVRVANGGTTLSTQTIQVANTGWQHFDLTAPVPVTGGTSYYFQIDVPIGSSITVAGSSEPNAYTGGSSSGCLADVAFRTYMPGQILSVNGNTGIWTANPTSPLTVAGTVESTAGGFKFPDGSVQTAAATTVASLSSGSFNVLPTGETVDQRQEQVGSGGCSPPFTYTQSFTAGISGRLVALDIYINLTSGSSDTSQLKVGINGGATIDSQSFTITSSGWQHIELASPMNVTSGSQYFWQVVSGNASFVQGAFGNVYTGGSGNCLGGQDFAFRSYVAGSGSPSVYTNASIGLGTVSPLARLDIAGGADADGSNDPKAIALEYRTGGFAHFIRTRHNGSGGSGNAIDFYTNSSATAAGSTAPGTGNTLALSLDGGKVGVGTTGAAVSLAVGDNDTGFNSAGDGLLDVYSNNTNTMSFRSGKVGIGTTSPSLALSVAGGMNIDNNQANTSSLNNALRFGSGASGEGIASNRSASAPNQFGLDFWTTSNIRMSLTGGGNLGIGTTSPGQKLSVVGTVESTSGGFKFPDGSTQTTASTPFNGASAGGDLTGSYPNPAIGANKVDNTKLASDSASLSKVSGGLAVVRSSGEFIDQRQENATYSGAQPVQHFTPSVNGSLLAMDLYLTLASGSQQSVQLQVYANAGFIVNQTITVNNTGWQHFAFDGPVGLSAGTQYTWQIGNDPGFNVLGGTNASSNGTFAYRTYMSGGNPVLDLGGNAVAGIFNVLGNLGVGTGNPTTAEEIYRPVSGGLGPVLRLTGGGNSGSQAAIDLSSYRPDLGAAPGTRIVVSDNNYSGDMDFQTKAPGAMGNALNTRMRISANGNVGIGTTNPGFTLDVNGNINANGQVYSFGSPLFSDARFKTDITPLGGALDTILALQGVTYDWNQAAWPSMRFPKGEQVGFIAQEVEKVLPAVVQTDQNGYKSVGYQNIVPVLVEGMKDQQRQLEEKDRQIAALQQQVADQRSRDDEIERRLRALEQRSDPTRAR